MHDINLRKKNAEIYNPIHIMCELKSLIYCEHKN